ncbi:MAG: hypothetical protein ABMA64_12240 [Myxococcota bacterium]
MTRWTLYALGSVEGQRVRRARDPVAAWLLRRHPSLQPEFAAPSILAMLRARAGVVDRMLEEEARRAQVLGQRVDYWGFGGGFDARWHRLSPWLGPVTHQHCEVDEPEVLESKDALLSRSNFSGGWQRVQRVAEREERWTVQDTTGDVPLVVLEGVAARLGVESVKRMLGRVRRDAPNARVVVDLPGILQPTDAVGPPLAATASGTRWIDPDTTSAAALERSALIRLGWRIEEDVWLAGRPELRAPSGMAVCPGVEPLRVLKLSAADSG